ncbi:MAG: hypothetical protein CMO29_18925 [Tistrella sp.]|nr:hypothetical protein [Tistrella sp.]
MATIGTFTRSGNEFKGSISTLFIQAKNVRFVPEDNHGNDKAPTHRMFSGTTVIGAAWSKKNREEREYLSVKFDDPSFAAPVYATLNRNDEDGSFSLIWSR